MEQEQSRSMRMFQIMDRLRRAWSEFHPSTDLNKSQLGTLLILRHGTEKPCAPAQQAQHKPMTMSELAARMGQSMPAVSQRISKLEAMGYVRRQSDPRDRRTTWIHLTDAGIEAEDFGGSTVVVRAVPADVPVDDVEDMIVELAAKLADGGRDALREKTEWVLHSIACRAAIKAGDRTNAAEMLALAQRIMDGTVPPFCPHGRPCVLKITRKELEKQFGRLV